MRVVGAVSVTGMVVADGMEQSKNFVIEFLMRWYVVLGEEQAAGSAPTGDNPRHRSELLHRAALVKRTGCRVDSSQRQRALRRSSKKFEMRVARVGATRAIEAAILGSWRETMGT